MCDKKLTETEIKTALKHCANIHCLCGECILFEPNDDECQCSKDLKLNALDLINRQKAEIERLERDVFTYKIKWAKAESRETKAKANAIKEFAERLKEKYSQADILCPRRIVSLTEKDWDNLVKEMVGDGK